MSSNVEKGDFARLRNVSLGYTIAPALPNRISVASTRIYVQVQNAALLTKYSGIDPEISTNSSGTNSNTGAGVDRNSVGQARTYTVGLNIGFYYSFLMKLLIKKKAAAAAFAALLALGTFSCQNDLLSPVPKTSLLAPLAFGTPSRVLAQVNNLYSYTKTGGFLGAGTKSSAKSGPTISSTARPTPSPASWCGTTRKTSRHKTTSFVAKSGTEHFLTKYPTGTPYTDKAPVIRYAEVLLNLAEARVRSTNTVDPQALLLLNAVRRQSWPPCTRRPALPPPVPWLTPCCWSGASSFWAKACATSTSCASTPRFPARAPFLPSPLPTCSTCGPSRPRSWPPTL
ncbi:MAG: RagB/SusD family nutrient uptake outer membrane protein [Janthinobacterium lividum]